MVKKKHFLFHKPHRKNQDFPRYHAVWKPVYDCENKVLNESSLLFAPRRSQLSHRRAKFAKVIDSKLWWNDWEQIRQNPFTGGQDINDSNPLKKRFSKKNSILVELCMSKLFNLFKSYLSIRSQYVQIDGDKCARSTISIDCITNEPCATAHQKFPNVFNQYIWISKTIKLYCLMHLVWKQLAQMSNFLVNFAASFYRVASSSRIFQLENFQLVCSQRFAHISLKIE